MRADRACCETQMDASQEMLLGRAVTCGREATAHRHGDIMAHGTTPEWPFGLRPSDSARGSGKGSAGLSGAEAADGGHGGRGGRPGRTAAGGQDSTAYFPQRSSLLGLLQSRVGNRHCFKTKKVCFKLVLLWKPYLNRQFQLQQQPLLLPTKCTCCPGALCSSVLPRSNSLAVKRVGHIAAILSLVLLTFTTDQHLSEPL